MSIVVEWVVVIFFLGVRIVGSGLDFIFRMFILEVFLLELYGFVRLEGYLVDGN